MLLNEIKDDPWEDIGYTKPVIADSPINKPIPEKSRINLNVPYNQREAAKRAGARWDPGIRKWYMIVAVSDIKNIPNAWR